MYQNLALKNNLIYSSISGMPSGKKPSPDFSSVFIFDSF